MTQRQQKVTCIGIIVISNSRFHCLSSRAIQILIHFVKHPTGSLQISPGRKKIKMENNKGSLQISPGRKKTRRTINGSRHKATKGAQPRNYSSIIIGL